MGISPDATRHRCARILLRILRTLRALILPGLYAVWQWTMLAFAQNRLRAVRVQASGIRRAAIQIPVCGGDSTAKGRLVYDGVWRCSRVRGRRRLICPMTRWIPLCAGAPVSMARGLGVANHGPQCHHGCSRRSSNPGLHERQAGEVTIDRVHVRNVGRPIT